jgi:hypothetical protein
MDRISRSNSVSGFGEVERQDAPLQGVRGVVQAGAQVGASASMRRAPMRRPSEVKIQRDLSAFPGI